MRTLPRLSVSLLLAVGVVASPLPPSTSWREVVKGDEDKVFADFGKAIQGIQDDTAKRDDLPLARGFHTKTHSVMRATFRVLPDLPEVCRQGIFREPASYDAWVRFSNLKPQRQADVAPDFRAMAVKILDVPGAPLTPAESSLDLMALNHPLQPARNIEQFIAFVLNSFNLKTFPGKLAWAIGVREASRMILWMTRNLKDPAMSLATLRYWSTLPIAYGDYAVKYRFDPQNGEDTSPDTSARDYLRLELTERLKRGPLRWDVMVQFYTDPENTPIEDAVVVWNPEVSPFTKVGELVIDARDLEAPDEQAATARGDQFLWNPWHAPAAHRPLGNLQRARRVGYPASGEHRNHTRPSPKVAPGVHGPGPDAAADGALPTPTDPNPAWEGLVEGR